MAEEIRRSGRATKGQHTKDREESASAPKKDKASKGKKSKSQPEPEADDDEEEDAIIRCICGEYNEEEGGRNMICCDKCEAWQHNDCMGLPDEYSPPKYYCEQCKPSDHKELLAAIKRGEKPWEEAAKRRHELEAEKAGQKKAKKSGRKSGVRAGTVHRTPTQEPEDSATSSKKRKLEESPVPAASGRSKKARSSLREDTDGASDVDGAAQDSVQQDAVSDAVAKDAKEIADPTRKKIAAGIIKSFVEQAENLSSKGALSLSKGETADSLGTQIALHVEHALYQVRSGGSGEPSDAYKEQMRAILNNIKSNADLAARLMSRDLSPSELAAMDPKDMATEEQKQRDADEKMRMEKQHVLTGEKGPRIRRTHKGEEYVDESNQPAESETSNAPVKRQGLVDQDVEMKSPTAAAPSEKLAPKRKPSAVGTGKPFVDPRRKSSSNFDIGRVWSGVQGSPTEAEAPKLADGAHVGSPTPAAGADADVDRLLKDEDNESEPYSPKEFIEEGVVWRGRVNGGSLGNFNAIAKFAAGCQPDVENLRMTWSEVIPSEIKLHGRIQPSKADDYLCGLEYSNTTELIIVSIMEPKEADEKREFSKFFGYLKQKDRYGVGSQHQVPAIKDIYLLPMEVGQALPTVMKALEHSFPDPVAERLFLVPIVIKWTELPHNAERVRLLQQQTQSPSLGPPVAQTPITPHDQHAAHFDQPLYGQPPRGLPVNGGTQYAPPDLAGAHLQSTPTPQQQPGLAHHPPAAVNAMRILGPEMAALPAVIDLIAQAPNAGENEFNIIKECIVENPEAGNSLIVLTQSLQAKYQSQRSAKEQGNNPGQSPVAAQT